MKFTTIPSSEGRKNLSSLIHEVDETGNVYIFSVHGESKAALVDVDLLEEFVENAEYGISAHEIVKRSQEGTVSLEDLKKEFNV